MSAPEVAESSHAGQEGEQEPESEPEPQPQPQPKWVALVSVVVLPGNENDERAQEIASGTDVLLDLNDSPLPSYLVLHPRVVPDPRRNDGPLSAYILAADRSACILLQVVEGNLPDFFLCNIHRRTVTIIPPVPSSIRNIEGLDIRPHLSIGLIADPDHRGHYLVAQLHPTTSKYHPNKLLCYSTAKGQWFARHLARQQARMCIPFSENGVLAHDGRLWWVALAYGVFFCDPFTPLELGCPPLRFLPLPAGCDMRGYVSFNARIRTLIDQRRCVRPSEGKLRFVEIRGISYDDAPPAKHPTVWMWTLDDPEGQNPWTFEYEVAFSEICDNAGLQPGEVPHVALVDPNDHYVVYFFQDMREKKVVACNTCLIDRDQLRFRSSRPIVDAWELPPPPPTLSGHDDSSPDDYVWSTQEKKRPLTRLDWTRHTGASDESRRAWQMVPPPSESTIKSGAQADDEPEIQLPLSSVRETQSPANRLGCFICSRLCAEEICSLCTAEVKRNLLAISKTVERNNGDSILGFCLHCRRRVSKTHYLHIHQNKTILLEWYRGKLVAWVTGREKWASIFHGIQGDNGFRLNIGSPFLIHRPKAIWCQMCNDVISLELLYASLTTFCSLKCALKMCNDLKSGNRGTEASIAEAMVAAEFSGDLNVICLTCSTVFSSTTEGDPHLEHDCIGVVTDSAGQSQLG